MHWIDRKDYGDFFTVSFESIVLDDWEVQEKTITITESQFDEAYHNLASGVEFRDKLKQRLGF